MGVFLLLAAALAQPKLDSMSPVQGGTQFVFSISDPSKYTLSVRTSSEGGKNVLVVVVTDDAVGPGPVVPPVPPPGPTPPDNPPAPADNFGMTAKVTKWAVDTKLPAEQCKSVAANYRSIIAAIAAGSLKASDIKAEALRRNQEVLGDHYADWTPFRDKANKAVADLVAAKKFNGTKEDFAQLYSEFAAGLEAVK